ncbi:hypothetical protein Mal52_11980 [Symmachiella dynata]|uniref:Uncharacterized protein n=1 Tax=Symmachiella dynata TaxID=2527995 RepID=A0A517ZJS8_9PLAN|nr:hypothetical protein [Symmachiella dynata]QDU42731.1 hypothetical protein Mal52_11980 [Symmachiella dynata]
MNHLERFLPSRFEILVIVVICGGLFALLYPAVQMQRNPKGPHGSMIPQEPPDERNRVFHSSGVSIVAPLNWDKIRDYSFGFPFLSVAARGVPGARLRSFIEIQLTDAPGEDIQNRYRPLRFQGWPAYERMQIDREDSFDDPASSSYELYVNRNDEWWLVRFIIADEMTELPPEIRRYLDTIRFPEEQSRLRDLSRE